MKPLLISTVCVAAALGASCAAPPRQAQSLFNGKDLTGWDVDVPAVDSNVRLRSPFEVRNGMLVSLGEPRGHLLSDSSYRDYRLEIEYRFAGTPGNAGVLVHASTPRALYGMFPRSIEVQMESGNAGDFWCIVEDIRVPDMERRRGPPAEWGITEGKARRIVNLTDDSEKPVGEWNNMVIEAVGRAVKVWVNGTLVNDGSDATADRGRIASTVGRVRGRVPEALPDANHRADDHTLSRRGVTSSTCTFQVLAPDARSELPGRSAPRAPNRSWSRRTP